MLRPPNAGNTMTFLTITTFNQLQAKPLMCTASPLPPSWAVSQRNSLTFQATPGSDSSGSTSACLHSFSGHGQREHRQHRYWPMLCVQAWSDFSQPQCINQCSCPSLASLQCIATAFRMSVFSVSFIPIYCLQYLFFLMLSAKPLCSVVLLPFSAILTNLILFIFHVGYSTLLYYCLL